MKNINQYLNTLLTPQMTKTFLLPASIWKRIGAFIIDIAIIDLIIFSPFKAKFAELISGADSYTKAYQILTSSHENISIIMAITTVITILIFSYFTLLEWKLGQTPGKIVMNTYLVALPVNNKDTKSENNDNKNENENNKISRPSFWQVVLSNLSLVPFFPFIILWPVEIISILFTNQRFMERVAKLQLVEAKVIDYYQSD